MLYCKEYILQAVLCRCGKNLLEILLKKMIGPIGETLPHFLSHRLREAFATDTRMATKTQKKF